MRLLPRLIVWAAGLLVAASTFGLARVAGYGTVLSQIVVLGSWWLLSLVCSDTFVDRHHGLLWSLVMVVNEAIFLGVARVIWLLSRKLRPVYFVLGTLAWLVFYLLCLFRLFPATDGP